MPPISKKRSRPDDDERSVPQRRRVAPPAPLTQQRQRLPVGQSSPGYRRQQLEQQQQQLQLRQQQQGRGAGGSRSVRIEEEEEEEEDDDDGEGEDKDEDDDESDGGDEGEERDQGEITIERLAKNLVRLALASEFSRQPIRRLDISTKVLGPENARLFKPVFSAAQSTLRTVFGMHLAELPIRGPITMTQKRTAARSQGTTNTQQSSSLSSSKSYILLTTLPSSFRVPEIISFPPSSTNLNQKEPILTALTTTICTLVYLNNRCLSEAKLDRYLKRLNIEYTTPIDKTEKILATMCKQQYLVKVKDSTSVAGETSFEYHLGPRAKLEIGKEGVTSLVREVYGVTAPQDLNERVARNIGVDVEEERRAAERRVGGGGKTQGGTQRQQQGQRGGGAGRRRRDEEEDEEEEGDDDEEDDSEDD